MTLDGMEIFRASDIPFNLAVNTRGQELTEERAIDPLTWDSDWRKIWESNERKQLHAAYDDAEKEVKADGNYPSWEIVRLLFDYTQMPFEKALTHEHPFIRAIALLDRRLGKRRWSTINIESETDLVQKCYRLRNEMLEDSLPS